ncbi:Uncharacterised protein [Mycobacterium xenopi]|uniref:Uncharacterized protein n=1 Tax=Mycobacterium xenopi TaxID=1789 RepID=A0AAD1LZ53_MYCXE|nr:hypothetical protein I552_0117 [Mycobacterium xenopi 3993]BBU20422.1 hypothetical protein MYXE_02110 [Mycobacterium xenopi]SPX79653.1 Uncharacterised protein [Mycobacterium xenopi]
MNSFRTAIATPLAAGMPFTAKTSNKIGPGKAYEVARAAEGGC